MLGCSRGGPGRRRFAGEAPLGFGAARRSNERAREKPRERERISGRESRRSGRPYPPGAATGSEAACWGATRRVATAAEEDEDRKIFRTGPWLFSFPFFPVLPSLYFSVLIQMLQ